MREVSGQFHALAALSPGKWSPVPTRLEAEWEVDPVWTLRSRDKFVATAGNQTQAAQPVAITTELLGFIVN